MSNIITFEDVTKTFDGRNVLRNVDLTIHKGEFICILGPSGCGKTTLLNLTGGFIKSDKGVITLKDKEVTKPVKECIMVFQEFDQLFPWKGLRANIEFPLRNSKIKYSKEEVKQKSSKYIKMVKLEGFEDYYPLQLSGGMKQRAAIARALVTHPEVLLMDEPFGSLDVQTRHDLHETLISIWEKTKTTIIFVTHDVREALTLADRIVILKDGIISKIILNHDKEVTEKKVKEIASYLSP